MASEDSVRSVTEASFAKSSVVIFVLWIGIAVAEFVGIFYVARVAGASIVGQYALFTAVAFLTIVFMDLGINEATKKRLSEGRSQRQYLAASMMMRYSLFAGVLVVLFAIRGPLVSYIGSSIAFPFLALSLFCMLSTSILSCALAGNKRVARSVFLQFISEVTKVIIWIPLIAFGYGFLGLLIGFLIGPAIGVIVGLILLPHSVKIPEKDHFSGIYRFAKYSWLSSFKETSWVWMDTLILGVFVVAALVGVYEISWQISAVFFFVASAVSTTLLPNVSELWVHDNKDQIRELVESTLTYTGIIAIPGFVGAIFVGEQLLSLFGEEFTAGYLVLLLLIFARVLHSYEIVLEKLVHAVDRPDLMFRANFVFIVLTVVLNVVFISLIEWRAAAAATALSMLVKTILVYIYATRQITFSLPLLEITHQWIAAGVMGFILLLLPASTDSLVWFILIIVVGTLVYGCTLLALSSRIRKNIGNIL